MVEVILKLKCKKCRHTWIPRVPDPLLCPHCKRSDWREEPKHIKEVEHAVTNTEA